MAFTEHTYEEIAKLKTYRQALNIPRSALTPHIGCSLSALYRWETGQSSPSPAFRSKIRAINRTLEEVEK
jgi:DNA-binding transcriptional regulator YiaG